MKKFTVLTFVLILFVFETGFKANARESQNTVYASFGDCFAAGAQASPITNSFASLTSVYLNKLHPHTHLVNCGIGGSATISYIQELPALFSKITDAKNGPLERATLIIGINDLTTIYEGCLSCTYRATFDQGVTCSYVYKSEIQTIINKILKFSPKCQLVLCTIPDPSDDGKSALGPFNPPGLIKVFNQRIFELGESNKLPVADFYTAMLGHEAWFVRGDYHPNNAGHAVMAAVVEAQFNDKGKTVPVKDIVLPVHTPTMTPTSTVTVSATKTASVLTFTPPPVFSPTPVK